MTEEKTMRINMFAAAFVLASFAWNADSLFAQHEADAMKAAVHRSAEVVWRPGPPSLPPGAEFAVLEGDPSKPGPFVFRVKVPDGYRIPPHIHPKPERVTILAGTFRLGMGETFDATKGEILPAGSYGTWPAGMTHYVWVEGETIVQFHGEGPWVIEYVNPADDPRKK
jgi:hypothetical protein